MTVVHIHEVNNALLGNSSGPYSFYIVCCVCKIYSLVALKNKVHWLKSVHSLLKLQFAKIMLCKGHSAPSLSLPLKSQVSQICTHKYLRFAKLVHPSQSDCTGCHQLGITQSTR